MANLFCLSAIKGIFMRNEEFNIQSITAADIQDAVEQVQHENASMGPLFPPVKDDWLICKKLEESVQIQKESNETLQAIEKNTANLQSLVDLIHNSVENQDQIISLMAEVFVIAKAKNKEEADSLCKRAMNKISDTVQDVETIAKLVSYAKMVYNVVQCWF